MAEGSEPIPQNLPAVPFVTIREAAGQPQIETNLPPELRPLMLWMLERAKLTVLTQQSEQEQSKILPANGKLTGLMKRMRHG